MSDQRNSEDKDLPLRDDIRLLGRVLGDTVRAQEGEAVFDLVEAIRQSSIRFRRHEDQGARRELEVDLGRGVLVKTNADVGRGRSQDQQGLAPQVGGSVVEGLATQPRHSIEEIEIHRLSSGWSAPAGASLATPAPAGQPEYKPAWATRQPRLTPSSRVADPWGATSVLASGRDAARMVQLTGMESQ